MDNPKSKYNKEKLDTKEMVFSSIVFLYIFLPLMLLIYFIVPKKFKNLVMIIASFIFFAWGEIRYIPIMLLLAVMDYWCGNKINQNWENKKAKRIMLYASQIT